MAEPAQMYSRCIPGVDHSPNGDGNWSFVPTFGISCSANTAPFFARQGTLLNVHLSHAPLHMDRWKLHLFYVVFLQLLLTNKKLFALGIFYSSLSVPNLETGKHPERRHKLQPSPATSPYHCFLCFKEEIGRNFTPFICVCAEVTGC